MAALDRVDAPAASPVLAAAGERDDRSCDRHFFATFFGGFRLEIEWGMLPGNGLILPLIVFGAWALLEQRRAARAQEA